ncbi:MAG: hypothetical protein M1376_18045 [Planctomycetes bacterium]|nr:hypothetical protein [Planctomycetota bacterium]
MTTEAQIEANRANAQKSTGPRTPEGKEKASRNALKHGLLAKEAVVVGEDLDEFDLFRDQYRAELAPVGIAESVLVERIVGLSWRLQRAERFGTESFDVLYIQCTADPLIKRWRPLLRPEAADPVVGLTVVKDFSETKVLERLMVYERRIENSLYRTMAELRQVQGRRQGEAGVSRWESRARRSKREGDRGGSFHRVRETPPPDFTLNDLLAQIGASEDKPADATTNTPEAESPSCETKPICGSPRGTGILPVNEDRRQDGDPQRDSSRLGTHADATVPPGGGTTNPPEDQSPSCDNASLPGVVPATKPISGEGVGCVPRTTLPAQSEMCETKPISEGVSSPKCQVSGPSCETKPISTGASREQFGYRPIFRRRR